MRPVVQPLTHENDRCRVERPLADGIRKPDTVERPGRPYDIAIFATVPHAPGGTPDNALKSVYPPA
jgi:hypothetical protein